MNTTWSKWIIYSLIIIGFLWIFFVIYWMTNQSDKVITNETQDTIITETNNIINSTENLPIICTNTLSLLDCMISSNSLSGDKEWINQYYQKLISEWNIITDDSLLEQQCTQHYNYIQWLQVTWYQSIIKSCMSK